MSRCNADWQRRSLRHVWHPCTPLRAEPLLPLPIASAQGPWLHDMEGRRYFDATSSWWVNLFGHADARLNAALKDQLDRLPHVMLAGCTHAPAVELAERLSALTQGALGHCFFASDGASAIEIALKMSCHSWRNRGQPAKRRFVALRQGYHGETLGALSVTDVAVFREAYAGVLMPAFTAMSPDARQALPGESPAGVAVRAAADLRALFSAHHQEIAALVIEPLVQCAGGMAMHDAAYLRAACALCDEFGVHLIADEIAVGCGRTGSFFAFEQATPPGDAPLWPDFICLSKGISGGYLPLSLVLASSAIRDSFVGQDAAGSFLHSHSYSGNALACRAALTVLQILQDEDVIERNLSRAALLNSQLAFLAPMKFPVIKKIWSSSFVLVAGGYSAVLLGLFYMVIDVWKVRFWTLPFLWIGMNAITLYMLENIFEFPKFANRFVGGNVAHAVGPWAEVTQLGVALLMVLLLARFLFRRGVFMRI